MRVALIHEALTVYGGAEKVLEELMRMFPEAPVFVPLYEPSAFPEIFHKADIRATWINRLPLVRRHHRALFPLYPLLMSSIDLSGYDLVISSSFNFAHNVVTPPESCHVCYCHSPPRFLWDYNAYARREGFGVWKRRVVESMLPRLRSMDRAAAQGVDFWVSTSTLVEQRIRKTYRRRSTIIPPPVDVNEFRPGSGRGEYFLLLMRLVGWKRPDIAVKACSELGVKLVVAGDGREMRHLKALAGPSVEFVGRVDGEAKAELYRNCTALILTSVEDFGITPLEAMASGRPVIALGEGGALDTVVPGETGELFDEQTCESLKRTLRHFNPERYDPAFIRRHAEIFDSRQFRTKLNSFLGRSVRLYSRRMSETSVASVDEPDLGGSPKASSPDWQAEPRFPARMRL
ncbi:glycosyltransferase [Afifella sp. H1R]|uniref:glycosyltransferase n=1 Tax=Afifella sp. H1R TaxID=2908841 RepID=UPI001F2D8966|nr:glycosyltransferase [Afifella sp. H1R]MCF1504287.1 glycosyltransferase [Afifella sp. H1R]